MSCWVVPTIAAEIWGVSLDHVMGQVSSGAIPSKVDYGFMLVDVAPGSDMIAAPPPAPYSPPPATFVPVSDGLSEDEVAALSMPQIDEPAAVQPAIAEASADELLALQALPSPMVTAVQSSEQSSEPTTQRRRRTTRLSRPTLSIREATPPAEDEEHEDGPDPNYGEADDGKPLDWRATRARVAMTRRRPPSFAAPAPRAAVA
jgi:hypothetical protein